MTLASCEMPVHPVSSTPLLTVGRKAARVGQEPPDPFTPFSEPIPPRFRRPGPGRPATLLTAALQDWTDFWFVPIPGGFLLYGDHDEYATIFAHRTGPVASAAEALRAAGFDEVDGYEREL